MRRELTFADAKAAIPYLRQLGISDVYLSPIHKARVGSSHGYDVLDHRELNPELGSETDLAALLDALAAAKMGVIFDVVPNHMCVASNENPYWMDVLENGRSSQYAHYFDIDWAPPKPELAGKVLLPFLGEQYGRVLESGLSIAYAGGHFFACFGDTRLPLSPKTWSHILAPTLLRLQQALGEDAAESLELESILRATGFLSAAAVDEPRSKVERQHELEVIRRRLNDLMSEGSAALQSLCTCIEAFTPTRLEALMDEQGYRLANWRVAAHEVNYRRFFDINELAAARVEDPDVFDCVHELLLRTSRHPAFTGFRIDHIDGLSDPEQYLQDLQQHWKSAATSGGNRDCYIVVEKILIQGESLRSSWGCSGTTGYDFIQVLSDVFANPIGAVGLERVAATFGRKDHDSFSAMAFECKRLMLQNTLAAELTVLARQLDRISEQHPYTRDFTLNTLHAALGDVIACFSVYRTYTSSDVQAVDATDRVIIERAVSRAKAQRTNTHASVFDFIGSVLLLQAPSDLDEAQLQERHRFVERFQQLCSPVFAKGVEDTTFYRYMPLVALNEVGCDPGHMGAPIADVHVTQSERLRAWPHTMSCTATHDTKRGEDLRARLYGLTERAEEWGAATQQWTQMNAWAKAMCEGVIAPDGSEELLLYQTLVGAWPMQQEVGPTFIARIKQYMTKARMEAKRQTSWTNPRAAYQDASDKFIDAVLDVQRSEGFMASIGSFAQSLSRPGYWTSLSQIVLKAASPGVPDVYQGTEGWDFSLVDPDNRRVVDFGSKAKELSEVMAMYESHGVGFVDELMASPDDGRIKTFVLARALQSRRAAGGVFENGTYTPLTSSGSLADHVVVFSRADAGRRAYILVGRWFCHFNGLRPTGAQWGNTSVKLDADVVRLRDVFTGETHSLGADGNIDLARLFKHLPVAWLESAT